MLENHSSIGEIPSIKSTEIKDFRLPKIFDFCGTTKYTLSQIMPPLSDGWFLTNRGQDIEELLIKANRISLRELKSEIVTDKLIAELKKLVIGKDEQVFEKLLEKSKNIELIVKFLGKLERTLEKSLETLSNTKKFNDSNLEVLSLLIQEIDNYKNSNYKMYAHIKELEDLCRDRYRLRANIKALIESIEAPIRISLSRIIDCRKKKGKGIEEVIEELRNQRNIILEILEKELKLYGFELQSLRDTVGTEHLKTILFNYVQDKTYLGTSTTLIRRSYFLKKAAKILLVAMVGLHVAGIGATTFSISFPNPLKMYEASISNLSVQYRIYNKDLIEKHAHSEVVFKSRAGYDLAGWFFNNPNTDKTVILAHGRSHNKSYEMPYVKELSKLYNVFVFDFRNHGPDSYGTTSIGAHEVQDLIGALDYLGSQGINEVAILGHSMGGAVTIMTTAQYRSPSIKIKAIITEGAFADLNSLLDYKTGNFLLPHTVSWPAKRLAEQVSDYKIENVSPIKFVSQVKVPMLILQGDQDNMVPPDSAKILYENAGGPAEIKEFHGQHDIPNKAVSELTIQFLSKVF